MSASQILATAAAAVASSAYLSARLQLVRDMHVLGPHVAFALRSLLLTYRDHISCFYLLEARARHPTSAKRPFLLLTAEGGRTHTYAETYEMALRVGHWLKTQHGVREKDVVAMDFANGADFVFVWFGLWAIGAKPAFVNHHLTGAPLKHCLQVSTARLVLLGPDVEDRVTDEMRQELSATTSMRFVSLTPAVRAEVEATQPVRHPDAVRSEESISEMGVLIYTSGTTGLPKPAIMTWTKLHLGAMMVTMLVSTTPADVIYTCMPLYHSSAAVLGLCTALNAGATCAIGRRFSTKTFWDEVRASKATMIQYVGETCRYLLVAPPKVDAATGAPLDKQHHVRVALGNGLRPDVWERFKERFGIATVLEFYSSTEGAGGTWSVSRNLSDTGAVGHVGFFSGLLAARMLATVELDLETETPRRDARTGFCRRCRVGEPGELLVRLQPDATSPAFRGYWGNKAATEAKVMRDVFARGDVWFRSGDLLRWDADGRLFFVDRIGDTFRWKGENVSTAEVAEALGTHPAVREANVYGVELPNHDGRAGCVALALALGPGASGETTPSAELLGDLATHVRKILPAYAVPLFLRLVKDVALQNTGTNKQQKHVLRRQGVCPSSVDGDPLYWLKNGTYVPFQDSDWDKLKRGEAKL